MIPDAVLAWVGRSLGARDAEYVRMLPGGTHAETSVVRADGHDLVLRRFPVGDDAVEREQRVLAAVDGLDGLAPEVLAADPLGSETGTPTILTTMLRGSAQLTPDDPDGYAEQLGVVLARIHARPVDARLPDILAGRAARSLPDDDWSLLTAAPPVLTHNDFWSGNTVWSEGRLTGVVDWSGAGRGPRGFDVAWARFDLVLLFGERLADVFTARYEHAAGVRLADLTLWDRFAARNAQPHVETWAPNYQPLGRPDLGPERLRSALDAWVVSLDRRS